MTTPTVTEQPLSLQPVTPPTFVFVAIPALAHPLPSAPVRGRRIVD